MLTSSNLQAGSKKEDVPVDLICDGEMAVTQKVVLRSYGGSSNVLRGNKCPEGMKETWNDVVTKLKIKRGARSQGWSGMRCCLHSGVLGDKREGDK